MIEVATGTVEKSGIKFRLLVSEPVDADDLRAIGNLLHGGAIKAEERLDAEGKSESQTRG